MVAKSFPFVVLVALLAVMAPSANAQNSNAVNSAKIEVLERQVTMLRTRLGMNPVAPVSGAGSGAGAAPTAQNPALVANLSAKIGTLETQIRRLTGKLEEFEHRQRLMQQDIDLVRKEMELLRQQPSVSTGGASSLGPKAPADEADNTLAADGGQSLALVEEAAVTVEMPEGDAASQFAFAFAFVRKNDLPRGQLAFEQFVERNPKDSRLANAKYWLGRIHLQEGRNAKAAQYLLALIEEHPNHAKRPDALVDLADVLLKLDSAGDACNALAEFRRVSDKASARVKANAERISAAARCQ